MNHRERQKRKQDEGRRLCQRVQTEIFQTRADPLAVKPQPVEEENHRNPPMRQRCQRKRSGTAPQGGVEPGQKNSGKQGKNKLIHQSPSNSDLPKKRHTQSLPCVRLFWKNPDIIRRGRP